MATNDKSHSVEFAKGGSKSMFGPQKAGEQKPGNTAHAAGAGSNDKFAKGGTTKMHGYAGVQPAQAGKTSAR